jgi:hypothetical protein
VTRVSDPPSQLVGGDDLDAAAAPLGARPLDRPADGVEAEEVAFEVEGLLLEGDVAVGGGGWPDVDVVWAAPEVVVVATPVEVAGRRLFRLGRPFWLMGVALHSTPS